MSRLATGLLLLFLMPLTARAQISDRLYGVVTTRDGQTYEGLIRWDKNEASWVDLLDGSKHMEAHDQDEGRRRSIRIFGIEINTDFGTRSRLSGIRFGHIRRLENTGRDRALLILRSGEEVELRGGSTDIGNENRGIVVEDLREGEVELRWRDIDTVDFQATPRNLTSRFGERLYGTLTTRHGDQFTGYICWDVDEVLTEDILDGDERRGHRRKIPFGDIAVLSRNSSSSTRVRLHNGDEFVLRGTNDVNDDNRGILILDPTLGQISVDWDEFDEVRFEPPAWTIDFKDFTGGPLYGTVYTRDGQKYTGDIRWDDDEAQAWELLNGEQNDVEFAIEFGMIAKIERLSSRAARVTLLDGRTFDLRGSNDVSDDNEGIFVTLRNGDLEYVEWEDFDRVVFSHR